MKINCSIFYRTAVSVFFLLLYGCVPPPSMPVDEKIPEIRILLGTVSAVDTLEFNGTYLLRAEEAVYEFGENNRRIYIQSIDNGYKVFNENRLLRFRDRDVCTFITDDPSATFAFRGGHFSGTINIVKPSTDRLSVINHIQLEAYLKAVVPAEIYTSQNDLLESAKAQAICSRTYALQRMGERRNALFDVHIDVRDQVYGSTERMNPVSIQAVDDTKGIVLYYDDSLATVYFHSTCGGILEDGQKVWENAGEPYLGMQQDVLGDSIACRLSPRYRWEEKRSIGQLDSSFDYWYGMSLMNQPVADTTELTFNLKISGRDRSGRVNDMMVAYGDTTLHLKNYEIRRFLGWPPGNLLPSTLIRTEQESDSTLIIYGGGAGHGVGMCQWGAMQMSREGFQYYHILGKYFKGCYLKKYY